MVLRAIHTLCEMLDALEAAPSEYHHLLRDMCLNGEQEQAIELARSMVPPTEPADREAIR